MLMFAFLDILRAQILAVEIHLHGAYLACSYPGPCTPLDKRLIRFFPHFLCGSSSSCVRQQFIMSHEKISRKLPARQAIYTPT